VLQVGSRAPETKRENEPHVLRNVSLHHFSRSFELDRYSYRVRRSFQTAHGQAPERWTALFLTATVLTSVTGFLFPFHRLLPSHILAILSLILLAVAIDARYGRKLTGAANRTYATTSVLALYLNVFVLIVQLFQKLPALKAAAPAQSEPPFKMTQLLFLIIFLILTIAATKQFRYDKLRIA
jgi:hypothetical protein